MKNLYALSFSYMTYIGNYRVQVHRWVPISAEQAIQGQYVSTSPLQPQAGEHVPLLALGASQETVFVSMGGGLLRDLYPGEKA